MPIQKGPVQGMFYPAKLGCLTIKVTKDNNSLSLKKLLQQRWPETAPSV